MFGCCWWQRLRRGTTGHSIINRVHHGAQCMLKIMAEILEVNDLLKKILQFFPIYINSRVVSKFHANRLLRNGILETSLSFRLSLAHYKILCNYSIFCIKVCCCKKTFNLPTYGIHLNDDVHVNSPSSVAILSLLESPSGGSFLCCRHI